MNLPNEITLIAHGVEVPLPADSQGIILLNIDSYAGGTEMWATGNTYGSTPGYTATRNPTYDDKQRLRQFRRTKSLE